MKFWLNQYSISYSAQEEYYIFKNMSSSYINMCFGRVEWGQSKETKLPVYCIFWHYPNFGVENAGY